MATATLFLTAPLVPAAGPTPGAASAMFAELEDELAELGYTLEDIRALPAHVTVFDPETALTRIIEMPVPEALALMDEHAGDFDVQEALDHGAHVAGPVTGVGSMLHLYADLEILDNDCDARAYRYLVAEPLPPPADVPLIVPNPLGVPLAYVGPAGGIGVAMDGTDYLLGVHAFMGLPISANANTAAPPADIAFGTDGGLDFIGTGLILEINVPLEIWGICIFALALGLILGSGSLTIDAMVLRSLGL